MNKFEEVLLLSFSIGTIILVSFDIFLNVSLHTKLNSIMEKDNNKFKKYY
jgi:hypothetical protein